MISVNALYAKTVPGQKTPGRKTDVSNAGKLPQLHSYRLLGGVLASRRGLPTFGLHLAERKPPSRGCAAQTAVGQGGEYAAARV